MQTFLIIGKNFSGIRDKILSSGDEYFLLQDILGTKYPNKRFKRRVVADFSSKSAFLEAAEQFRGKVDGVICLYENYIVPASIIAQTLGLPGMPLASAEACTDKDLMRELFSKAPAKISPEYMVVRSKAELLAFAENHDFPLMLKPANLVKSLLITKNHDIKELLDNYQKATEKIDSLYQKYAPGRKPKLIVEEFMEGPVHSIDAFVDAEGNPNLLEQIVDYQTGYDIGYDDNFHYSRIIPTKLGPDDQQKLKQCAEIGVKALGMKSSPAHIEIIMTGQGPRIVEIGARNGGYRARMHGLANGIDVIGNTLLLALGKKPNITASRNDPCAVLELFPKNQGIFDQLAHEKELRELPSVVSVTLKAKPGQLIGKSSDGYKMTAIITLHNTDPDQLKQDLAYIQDNVSVVTT